ncbi:MAG: hypothetical protein Q7J98_12390 [Kiritimatiellia bacterium]|nr:hypothetical protein [Kiritimatiellia bacterium]
MECHNENYRLKSAFLGRRGATRATGKPHCLIAWRPGNLSFRIMQYFTLDFILANVYPIPKKKGIMSAPSIMFAVFAVVLAAASLTQAGEKPQKTPAEMAAFLDRSHNTARYESLVGQLSKSFKTTEQEVVDQIAGAVTIMKQDGVTETFLNIMEGLNKISGNIQTPYNKTVTAYCFLRIKGFSHDEVIANLATVLAQKK